MELLFALVIGALTASGVYLLLRARTFPVIMGITLLSYGVNLFLFATGCASPPANNLSSVRQPPMRTHYPRHWCSRR